jgi:hypothetical protein
VNSKGCELDERRREQVRMMGAGETGEGKKMWMTYGERKRNWKIK